MQTHSHHQWYIGSYARCHPALSDSVDEFIQALLPDPCANFPCLDTSYSKYINTNYAASAQDIRSITEIIHQRQSQLDDVTAELVFVESIMKRVRDIHEQLLDKRNQITTSMQTHQGLISCIRRLPPELLGEIFVRCLPPGGHVEPDTTTAPLVLLAVCRGWRRVALKTPRLWCSLEIRPNNRVHQQGLYFYHHWLSRARSCPLSLAVDARRPPRNPVWRYEITELLQPYMSRAERLRIMFDDATAPELLLRDTPMLQHLTLDGSDLRIMTNQTTATVRQEWRLKSLTLHMDTLGTDVLAAFNPGWTHLTALRVTLGHPLSHQDVVDGPIVLTLLELCPYLQEFAFSPIILSRRDAPSRECTLKHTRLYMLDVVVLFGVGPLLDALTLPNLQHLKIRDLDILPSAWKHNEFKAFVTRSRCPLETLTIHGGAHGSQVGKIKADRQAYAALIPTLKQIDLSLGMMRT